MKYNNYSTQPQNVAVTSLTIIVKAEPDLVHEHREPLSSLDLFIPNEDVAVIFFYHKPKVDFNSMVTTLKKSLADTLVHYYVFAGELVSNDDDTSGELEILCNNRGVDFTEASVDLELTDLDLHKPDELIRGQLAPKKTVGNLAVQVTQFLKCGSVLLTCMFDHRVADAYSTNMFLTSWSENALSKPLITYSPPSRMIFTPRSYLRPGSDVESFYSPISSLPPSYPKPDQSPTSRVYHIAADQIINLQTAASTEASRRTKLESFSAFLWQLLAKSSTREDFVTKMSIVVDGRSRLASVYDSQVCTTYFGNVIAAPYGSETVESISHKPLNWVGQRVAEVIKAAANKDHFLDLIDLVETIRPDTTIPTVFWPRSNDGPKVVVSSGLRFPVDKIDFGFGKPILGFYCLPWIVDSGYVMPAPIPDGNGDWVVYMHLPRHQLEFIEKEASHVFKPFTFDLVR
ncbi:unnamed protein product [Rhodiola kirilowii]